MISTIDLLGLASLVQLLVDMLASLYLIEEVYCTM